MRSKKDRPGGQLSIVFDHASSSAASWTGAWNTDFGAMSLTESGNHVTGTYAYCNGTATISGQVTGSTLTGTWTQPCNSRTAASTSSWPLAEAHSPAPGATGTPPQPAPGTAHTPRQPRRLAVASALPRKRTRR